ncbi:MAG: arsenite methyltransferase [Bacteroidales bacterium]|nr:arsenite methyltransferase [Bacteroidales bacterium]
MDQNQLRQIVKEKYSEIAEQSRSVNESSCCGATGCCGDVDYTIFSENYENLEGYHPDADLGLGCGIPTEFAQIKAGDTVIDLGSGAGNDCFVARSLTGEKGKVIGIDFTQAMIDKARENAEKLGFNNVEFRFGDIEKLPVTAAKADVIISNCVLNLVPDKVKAFSEIYRVLKPGGHLSVSDVVLKGELPEVLKTTAEMYAGCVSGAVQKDEYLQIMQQCGLENIKIQKEKVISVPDDILLNYISEADLSTFRQSGTGIYSITVYAEKPMESNGCGCGCSC